MITRNIPRRRTDKEMKAHAKIIKQMEAEGKTDFDICYFLKITHSALRMQRKGNKIRTVKVKPSPERKRKPKKLTFWQIIKQLWA